MGALYDVIRVFGLFEFCGWAGNGDGPLGGGSAFDRLHSAFQSVESLDGDSRPTVNSNPTPIRDIGQRLIVRQPFTLLASSVENFEEPPTLILIAVDSRLDLLREIPEEDVGLPSIGRGGGVEVNYWGSN